MDEVVAGAVSPVLLRVLESAARLQELVPDAVLVGGSAAALYARHRDSFDHDHVLADLRERFDAVLDALESDGEWVTNRVTPGRIILGELGDIEAGVRQMIRLRPLEVRELVVPSGRTLRVPTADEALRIKAFLIVRRNRTRDFVDVVALTTRHGVAHAADVLAGIDDYYGDQRAGTDPVALGIASQLARQLADPQPKDVSVTRELDSFRNLASEWSTWGDVKNASLTLAMAMLDRAAASGGDRTRHGPG